MKLHNNELILYYMMIRRDIFEKITEELNVLNSFILFYIIQSFVYLYILFNIIQT